ncbi:hypothetical protein [Chloroflexus aggregans]|uniref:DUF5668 domain-containing protein n=1 Tax=Chloroflexus aggregans (strain MD-66 / DSM 9485) TaxID=326427 RepID=B8G5G2_CHLAD|nr:hypothetical protein [Chloroflexus aggregans]ACL25668.1 conserved hypothetical protein [Chloroflexus aggregans DSM 9485]
MTTETMMHERRNRVTVGLALIGLGLVFLLGYVINTGLLVLPLMALIFALVGIRTHEAGWFIPAGILGGVGLGAILVDTLLLPESLEGGVFLLSFAAGWVSIPLLSALFADERVWWPFIPAGVMAVIGSLILVGEGGMTLLDFVFNRAGWVWPLVLITIGVVLILRKPQE